MKISEPQPPIKSDQTPATSSMLYEMEGRLSHKMDSGFKAIDSKFTNMNSKLSSIDSRFNSIDSTLNNMDSRFNSIDSTLNNMDSRFNSIDSTLNDMDSQLNSTSLDIYDTKADIHYMRSELHRVALLVEEQNARNKYVLDGYAQLYDLHIKKD